MAAMDEALERLAGAIAAKGSLLFHLFLAEALAAQALSRESSEVGWGVDVGPDGYEVIALDGMRPTLVTERVSFSADGTALVESRELRPASDRQVALWLARAAAAEVAGRMDSRHAVAVPPPPRSAPWPTVLEAYLLRLPTRPGEIAVGPHWRLRLRDGRADAIEPAITDDLLLPAPAQGERLALLHAGASAPSELHVFLSLNHGVGLDVATTASGLLWRIDGERLSIAG